jgi:hypothetical protein
VYVKSASDGSSLLSILDSSRLDAAAL